MERDARDAVREAALWFTPPADEGISALPSDGIAALLELIGDARVVLVGEATDGTPKAAARARYRFSCFEQFGTDPQSYGYAADLGLSRPCEDDVVAQLAELRSAAAEYARRDGDIADDEYFFAEQNARLVRNAEMYYRAMFAGQVESWNLRDTHMMETLDALLAWTTNTPLERWSRENSDLPETYPTGV